LSFFRERKAHGEALEKEWNRLVSDYEAQYPEKAAEFARRRVGDLNSDQIADLLTTFDIDQFKGMATREANGLILQKLWEKCPALCGGGADLVTSNKFLYSETDVFLPSAGFQGRYIRHGIREHAMAAISNGLAAYGPGTFLPVTATFLIFYLYVSEIPCHIIWLHWCRRTHVLFLVLTRVNRPPLGCAWAH
jgi:dihydroxyacetone synthase